MGFRGPGDLNVLALVGGAMVAGQETEKGAQQGFAIGDGEGCMDKLANKRLEVSHFAVLASEELFDLFLDLVKFGRGQFNGALDAIKDPSKNFLPEGPNAFALQQFLEGHGFFIWVGAAWGCLGKDGVDSLEEGT